jgi:hypothetical protein
VRSTNLRVATRRTVMVLVAFLVAACTPGAEKRAVERPSPAERKAPAFLARLPKKDRPTLISFAQWEKVTLACDTGALVCELASPSAVNTTSPQLSGCTVVDVDLPGGFFERPIILACRYGTALPERPGWIAWDLART